MQTSNIVWLYCACFDSCFHLRKLNISRSTVNAIIYTSFAAPFKTLAAIIFSVFINIIQGYTLQPYLWDSQRILQTCWNPTLQENTLLCQLLLWKYQQKKVVCFISEITHHYYTLFDACTGYNCSVFWFHECKMKRKWLSLYFST